MDASQRRWFLIVSILLAVTLALQIGQTAPTHPAVPAAPSGAVLPAPLPAAAAMPVAHVLTAGLTMSREALIEAALRDPDVLGNLGQERYAQQIRDYSCVFIKQERIDDKLGKAQEIRVLYREQPHSVYMTWLRNVGDCRRALFVAGRWTSDQGEPLAMVEPAGALIRLIVAKTKQPIHGPRAQRASRRFIDQFGFKSTLDLFVAYNKLAAERGVLKLWYDGEGRVDGRPTFRIVRHLPYTGPGCEFPDARMVIHFDQEWLLPVAVYSWADVAEKTLLGSYVMTHVVLNPQLPDSAFEF